MEHNLYQPGILLEKNVQPQYHEKWYPFNSLIECCRYWENKIRIWKEKFLFFCCFRHNFASWVSPTRWQLYWIPQPLGKLNLNVERKMLVFLLFPTHVSKLGSRTRCLEVQMTTAKSCCFIQDKNIDISDKTTKRKATWGFPIFLRTSHPSSGDLMTDGKVVTIQ